MKQRKLNALISLICLLAVVLAVFAAWGCTSSTPTTTAPTTTAPTTTAPTTTQPATTQPATSPGSETKTLKVVVNLTLGHPLGADQLHGTQVDVEKVNAAGGLDIGGTKYKIDLIVYDDKNEQVLAQSNMQRAIFDDKASFILGGPWNVGAYFGLAESNDVVLLAWPVPDFFRSPDVKHCYQTTITDTNFLNIIAYAHQLFPDLKTYLGIFPDEEMGNAFSITHPKFAKTLGFTVLEPILYPPGATDLSAIGTKIKTLNPDIIDPHGGGPPGDSQVFKAAYDAGWRGQVIDAATIPGQTIIGIAGAEPVEGMIALAWPAEFEPATHPMAAQFKADYIAKNGKWDDPEIVGAIGWWVLKAALQQAGSIEPAKVRALLDNGMKFDSIGGSGQMIARPDFGITRTMEVVLGDMPVKKISGGKVSIIHTFSLDEALALWKLGKGIK